MSVRVNSPGNNGAVDQGNTVTAEAGPDIPGGTTASAGAGASSGPFGTDQGRHDLGLGRRSEQRRPHQEIEQTQDSEGRPGEATRPGAASVPAAGLTNGTAAASQAGALNANVSVRVGQPWLGRRRSPGEQRDRHGDERRPEHGHGDRRLERQRGDRRSRSLRRPQRRLDVELGLGRRVDAAARPRRGRRADRLVHLGLDVDRRVPSGAATTGATTTAPATTTTASSSAPYGTWTWNWTWVFADGTTWQLNQTRGLRVRVGLELDVGLEPAEPGHARPDRDRRPPTDATATDDTAARRVRPGDRRRRRDRRPTRSARRRDGDRRPRHALRDRRHADRRPDAARPRTPSIDQRIINSQMAKALLRGRAERRLEHEPRLGRPGRVGPPDNDVDATTTATATARISQGIVQEQVGNGTTEQAPPPSSGRATRRSRVAAAQTAQQSAHNINKVAAPSPKHAAVGAVQQSNSAHGTAAHHGRRRHRAVDRPVPDRRRLRPPGRGRRRSSTSTAGRRLGLRRSAQSADDEPQRPRRSRRQPGDEPDASASATRPRHDDRRPTRARSTAGSTRPRAASPTSRRPTARQEGIVGQSNSASAPAQQSEHPERGGLERRRASGRDPTDDDPTTAADRRRPRRTAARRTPAAPTRHPGGPTPPAARPTAARRTIGREPDGDRPAARHRRRRLRTAFIASPGRRQRLGHSRAARIATRSSIPRKTTGTASRRRAARRRGPSWALTSTPSDDNNEQRRAGRPWPERCRRRRLRRRPTPAAAQRRRGCGTRPPTKAESGSPRGKYARPTERRLRLRWAMKIGRTSVRPVLRPPHRAAAADWPY